VVFKEGSPSTKAFGGRIYHLKCLNVFHPEGTKKVLSVEGPVKSSSSTFVPPPPLPERSCLVQLPPAATKVPELSLAFRASSLEEILQGAIAMGLFADRTLRLGVNLRRCLVGKVLVSYLVTTGQCADRKGGLALGQALMDRGLLLEPPVLNARGVFEDRVDALYCHPPLRHTVTQTAFTSSSMPVESSFLATQSEGSPSSVKVGTGFVKEEEGGQEQERGDDFLGTSWRGDEDTPQGDFLQVSTTLHDSTTVGEVEGQGPPHTPPSITTISGIATKIASVWSVLRSRASFTTAQTPFPTTKTTKRGEERDEGRPRKGTSSSTDHWDVATGKSSISAAIILESKVLRVGWLFKLGHVRKNWKRRWFVLKGFSLLYFRRGPRSETSAEAAVAAANIDTKNQLNDWGGGSEDIMGAILPPNKESPAGSLDIRDFTLESAASSTRTPKLALKLSSRREVGEFFIMVAENEASFVGWVRTLATTLMKWEQICRDEGQ